MTLNPFQPDTQWALKFMSCGSSGLDVWYMSQSPDVVEPVGECMHEFQTHRWPELKHVLVEDWEPTLNESDQCQPAFHCWAACLPVQALGWN